MKTVIQRVTEASVAVEGKTVGSIGKGLMILVGVGADDTKENADYLAKKISAMRIFEDGEQHMNLSVKDVEGEILVISQFTLFADCRKGNRPNFMAAGKPEISEPLYEYFCDALRSHDIHVETGIFGADMKVSLVNDGPVTIVFEK